MTRACYTGVVAGHADALRTRTVEAWAAFVAAFDGADPDATTSAGWTTRELVAHVAFWLETVPPFVTGALRGDPSAFDTTFPSGYVAGEGDWPAADVHNEREAAWARDQTWATVWARTERAYGATATFLVTVTDGEATTHATYFAEIADHLDAHRTTELTPG